MIKTEEQFFPKVYPLTTLSDTPKQHKGTDKASTSSQVILIVLLTVLEVSCL
jgi:hypothetical protein